jgi:hypothetical protein
MIKNKEEKDNASINITSLGHYNQLLSDGFELKSVRFYGHPRDMNCSLVLVKDNQEIVANAKAIDDYFLHLRELYQLDFEGCFDCWMNQTTPKISN